MSAPAAVGRVEQGITDLLAAHRAIQTRNGYRFDVRWTSRHYIDPDSLDPDDVPAIIIYRPLGESEDLEPADELGDGAYISGVMLLIMGFVRAGGENPDVERLARMGEAYLSDIRKLHLADVRYGSAVIADSTLLAGAMNDAAFDSEGAMVLQPIRLRIAWDAASGRLP
jgi:hypothetical protein